MPILVYFCKELIINVEFIVAWQNIEECNYCGLEFVLFWFLFTR